MTSGSATAPLPSLWPGARLDQLCPALWFGGWQVLFDYSSWFWVRRRDGCFGECKFLKKPTPSIHPPAGLITDITDLDEFKQRSGIKSRAKTLSDLIKYLDTLSEQSWNVNKTFRSNSGKIRTVGIYDSSPMRTPQNSSNSSAPANTPSCASHPGA